MKILVVDDDLALLSLVSFALRQAGYLPVEATDGRAALAVYEREQPNLVILDVNLPGLSGFEVCQRLRALGTTPIMLLTVRNSDEDEVHGLDLGADDYLTKPFSPRELVARVRAVLRRTQGTETPLVEVLSFDSVALEIDTVQHEVRRDGDPVELTPNEYKLLQTLARYPGRVYSRFELINHVQGYEYEGYERTIDAHVKNLRKKIEPDPRHPRYVETVFGTGYRMRKG